MRRHNYPVAATVIGLLLGRMTEGELVRTMQISGGDPLGYMMTRPIALGFFILLIMVTVLIPLLRMRKARKAG